ncbi:hypothetical protein NLG97_g1880 [Lecanicillium saksenae]|uniref:Uncharacterized protein n=1 Tax=Lecanicillium saksenae TaxID=468837 RepID=A0ACC1R6M0_9HYPO|nr:hypothetical protein NLG97_g1880 [Lecanicillium saksenae]
MFLLGAVLLLTSFLATRILYNIFYHPLSKYPAPLVNRASVLPKVYHLLRGSLPSYIAGLHSQYGRVVRITPSELSFTDPQAWNEIYGRKLSEGRYEIPHDDAFYSPTDTAHRSLMASGRESHDSIRKLLAPGFSDRSIRTHEATMKRYIERLIHGLQEACIAEDGSAKVVNMRDWIAFCTFDLIGDLTFGSDFGCLRDGAYHPWVALISSSVRDMAMLQALNLLGLIHVARLVMTALGVGKKALKTHVELIKLKTDERVRLGTERNDFLNTLLQHGTKEELLRENGSLLIVAGSETTATLLTGVLFLLASRRDVLSKLNDEVRGDFEKESDINVANASKLPYLSAVLKEALRYYPPAALAAPRRVGHGGATIAGNPVPEGTVVGVWQWAMYRDPCHFNDPNRFNPDRFLNATGSEKLTTGRPDNMDAFNPFLVGPRNCIGQNLAYAEMRLILARLIWRFDFRLCKDSETWMDDQENYILWEKPELNMYLTPTWA